MAFNKGYRLEIGLTGYDPYDMTPYSKGTILQITLPNTSSYTRAISTSLALSTSVTFGSVIHHQSFTTSLAIATSYTRTLTTTRSISTSLAVDTSYSRAQAFTAAYDSDLTLATSYSKISALTTTYLNDLALDDSFTRLLTSLRSYDTDLTLDTDYSRAQPFTMSFTTNLALDTDYTRVLTAPRAITTPLALTDDYTRASLHTARPYDTSLALGTSYSRAQHFTMAITTQLSLDTDVTLLNSTWNYLTPTLESTYYSNSATEASIARLDDTHIIMTYIDSSNDGYLRVASLDANNVPTYGDPYLFDNDISVVSIAGLSSTKAVVLAKNAANNNKYLQAFTISGITVTAAGSPSTFSSAYDIVDLTPTIRRLTDTKFVYSYRGYYTPTYSYMGFVGIGTVATDNTFTLGTQELISSGYAPDGHYTTPDYGVKDIKVDPISSTTILVGYVNNYQDGGYNKLAVASVRAYTISGNTLTPASSANVIYNVEDGNYKIQDFMKVAITVISSTKALMTVAIDNTKDGDGTQKRYAAYIDISGSTVSVPFSWALWDTNIPVLDSTADTDARINMATLYSNTGIALYTDTSTCNLTIKKITVDGSTMTIGLPQVLNSQGSASVSPALDRDGIIQLTAHKLAIAFIDPGDSAKAKLLILADSSKLYESGLTLDTDYTRSALSMVRSYDTDLALDTFLHTYRLTHYNNSLAVDSDYVRGNATLPRIYNNSLALQMTLHRTFTSTRPYDTDLTLDTDYTRVARLHRTYDTDLTLDTDYTRSGISTTRSYDTDLAMQTSVAYSGVRKPPMSITTSLAVGSSYTRALTTSRPYDTDLAMSTLYTRGLTSTREYINDLALSTSIAMVFTAGRVTYNNSLALDTDYTRILTTTRTYDTDLILATDVTLAIVTLKSYATSLAVDSDYTKGNATYTRSYTPSLALGTSYDMVSGLEFTRSYTTSLTPATSLRMVLMQINQLTPVIAAPNYNNTILYKLNNLNGQKLVRDTTGYLYIVVDREESGLPNTIRVRRSIDNGATWQEMATFCDPARYAYNGTIAVDSNKALHVAWYEWEEGGSGYTEIRYAKYSNNAWSSVTNITTGSTTAQLSPSIAIDSSNNIHMVWSADVKIRYKKYTTLWSSIADLVTTTSPSFQNSPSIHITPDDKLHVVWSGKVSSNWQIRYITYTSSWSAITNLTSDATDKFSAYMAIYDNTNYAFTWYKHSTNTIYALRYINGVSQGIEVVATESAVVTSPHIMYNYKGQLYVVWQKDGVGVRQSKYTSVWSIPATKATNTGDADYLSLCTNFKNFFEPIMVYEKYYGDIYFRGSTILPYERSYDVDTTMDMDYTRAGISFTRSYTTSLALNATVDMIPRLEINNSLGLGTSYTRTFSSTREQLNDLTLDTDYTNSPVTSPRSYTTDLTLDATYDRDSVNTTRAFTTDITLDMAYNNNIAYQREYTPSLALDTSYDTRVIWTVELDIDSDYERATIIYYRSYTDSLDLNTNYVSGVRTIIASTIDTRRRATLEIETRRKPTATMSFK